MKAKKMVANIGINPGYGHDNKGEDKDFNKIYLQIAGEVFASCGIYISAVSKETRTLYNKEWGCPEDGEVTFEITSTANPEFVADIKAWQDACLKVITLLKDALGQSTVTVEFFDVELLYIK